MEFDARNWDEELYRDKILKERALQSLTVFRTAFSPSQNPNPDIIVVASSDGSVAPYSISSSNSIHSSRFSKFRKQMHSRWFMLAEPICALQGHNGPAYDVKFFGHGEDSLLLRSGKCVNVIDPEKGTKLKGTSSWISCIDLDSSECWLACGSGRSLSVWSLPAFDCISRIAAHSPTQDVLFNDNQILAVGAKPVLNRFDLDGTSLSQIQCAPQSAFSISLHSSGVTAVGGYGGLVDVISPFGSHICTFCCQGC